MSDIKFSSRRRTLQVLGALGASAAWPQAARAQAYPTRPIRLVVPYAAGGIADVLGRLVAQRLGPLMGQTVVVENRPGVGGHLGGAEVARSAADGYTLVLATIAHNGATAMYRNLTYDPSRDLTPLVLLAESAGALVVHPSVPVSSVREFVALAKAQPGRLTYGSAGNGSALHMAAELFEHLAGVKLSHVPYRGSGPALNDLIGGQIQCMFDNLASSLQHIRSGRLKVLGVTSPQAQPSLPEVPPIGEAVPGYASVPWYTLSAPRGLPDDVVRRLNSELNAVVRSTELRERWEALGVTPVGGSVEDALRRNAVETERWTKVIRAAGIVAE